MTLTPSRQARLSDALALLRQRYEAVNQQPDLASIRQAASSLRFATIQLMAVINDLDDETRAEARKALETA